MVINIYRQYLYNSVWDLKIQKVSEDFDQEMPQSHTVDQPIAPIGRITEHQQPYDEEDNWSKVTSNVKFLLLFKYKWIYSENTTIIVCTESW